MGRRLSLMTQDRTDRTAEREKEMEKEMENETRVARLSPQGSEHGDLPRQPPVWQPRIWAVHCPFRKSGSPVLGNFGYTERGVIIIPADTWTRLCREIPALAVQQFEVGTVD